MKYDLKVSKYIGGVFSFFKKTDELSNGKFWRLWSEAWLAFHSIYSYQITSHALMVSTTIHKHLISIFFSSPVEFQT